MSRRRTGGLRRLSLCVRLRYARHHATANLRADQDKQNERSAAALLETTEQARAHAIYELEQLRADQQAYQKWWAGRVRELERELECK